MSISISGIIRYRTINRSSTRSMVKNNGFFCNPTYTSEASLGVPYNDVIDCAEMSMSTNFNSFSSNAQFNNIYADYCISSA